MMTSHSRLIVKLCHNFMVYLSSHPGILWCIPVNSHVLYFHSVLLQQALWCLSLAYNSQLSVVRSIHVGNNKQCQSVFTFYKTSRLVTIKAVHSVRERLVEQSCFLTVVNILGEYPAILGRRKVSFQVSNSSLGIADSFIPHTGRTWLIWIDSMARFSFKLSGNLN